MLHQQHGDPQFCSSRISLQKPWSNIVQPIVFKLQKCCFPEKHFLWYNFSLFTRFWLIKNCAEESLIYGGPEV